MRRTIAATNAIIKCRNNDCYNFEIPLDGSRAIRDGDDLALQFPNGDRLVLEDYYKKSVSILVDGEEIPADDFFTARESDAPLSSHGSVIKFDESPALSDNDETPSLEGIGHLEAIDPGEGARDAGTDPFSNPALAFLSQPEESYFENSAYMIQANQESPASESNPIVIKQVESIGTFAERDEIPFPGSAEVPVSVVLADMDSGLADTAGEESQPARETEPAPAATASAQKPESQPEQPVAASPNEAGEITAFYQRQDTDPQTETVVETREEIRGSALAEADAEKAQISASQPEKEDADDKPAETVHSGPVLPTRAELPDSSEKLQGENTALETEDKAPAIETRDEQESGPSDENTAPEIEEMPVVSSDNDDPDLSDNPVADEPQEPEADDKEPVTDRQDEVSGIDESGESSDSENEEEIAIPSPEKEPDLSEKPVEDGKPAEAEAEDRETEAQNQDELETVKSDEKTEPVSEEKFVETDSKDETSETAQSKPDENQEETGGNSGGVAQQDEIGETGSGTEPEHTFKSVINLPDDVVSIIRVVKQGKYGEIVQREDGEWVYQLNGAINSGDEQGSNTVPEADFVYVMILDKWGNKLRTKVTVSIIDDVPELDVKGDEDIASGSVFTGKIAYNYGADYIDYDDRDPKHFDVKSGVETVSVNDFEASIVIKGQYGVLTIQPNGKYSYKANPLLHGQEGGTDTFTFSITDADGDTVTKNLDGSAAGLTFTVTKPAEPEAPVISEVYEKALPDGTEPGDPSSTVTIPDCYTLIVKEGGDHPGHLEKNPAGSWKYVLDKPIGSGDEQGQNTVAKGDSQTVVLRDKDGNEWEFDVSVSIVDDAPVAEDDSNEITKGQESVVSSGSVLDNDRYGADREAGVDSFVWNTADLTADENGRYVLNHGSIQLNADGTYAYYLDNTDHDVITLTEGKSLFDTLTYTIKDADGDVATASLTIEIKGKDNGITITPKDPDKDPDPVPDPDDKRDKTPDPTPDPTDPDQPDPVVPTEPRDPDITVDPADPSTTAAVEQIKERELRSGEPVKRHGDLEVSAPDGVTSILMNGEDLIDGELHTFGTEIGTLTIRYDRESETGGRLKYEYILNNAADHEKATTAFDNTDLVQEIFRFTVTDSDGTEASSRIIIRVIDDVPTAANDVATVEEGATAPISGNVLTGDAEGKGKDEYGADGKVSENSLVWNGLLVDGEITAAESEGIIQGQYGTFRPGEDGNWTYELNNASEAVQALKGSYSDEEGIFHEAETLTEVIRYTIRDADGDVSEATLTITITGKSGDPSITPTDPDPEIPGDPDKPVDPDDPKTQGALITVHEKNLSDGTDPDAGKLTVSGTMAISAPDGVKSLYVGDQEISLDGTPATIRIGENVLTLIYTSTSGQTGTLSYSFTLTDELSHKDGEMLLNELLSKYQLTLTDLEGKTARSVLHVKIIDDNPEMTLAEDIELDAGHAVDVNPFTFTVGADNGDGKKLVVTFKNADGEFVTDSDGNVLTIEIAVPNSAWEIKGKFGTLSHDGNGNYAYKADPFDEDALGETEDSDEPLLLPSQVKDIFNFILVDADGDATEPEDWTATINKPGYSGNVEVPEALQRPLIAWEADLVDGEALYEITVPEDYGLIEVTGSPKHGEIIERDGKWFYKLTEPVDSGEIQGSNWVKNADSFVITVERESDGAWFDMRVPVTIVDDVPEFGEAESELTVQVLNTAKEKISGEAGEIFYCRNSVLLDFDGGLNEEGVSFVLQDALSSVVENNGRRFVFDLEADESHPDGRLIVERMTDGVWAATYLQGNGTQRPADFNLSITDGNGKSVSVSFTCGISSAEVFHWEGDERVSETYAPELSDGQFVIPSGDLDWPEGPDGFRINNLLEKPAEFLHDPYSGNWGYHIEDSEGKTLFETSTYRDEKASWKQNILDYLQSGKDVKTLLVDFGADGENADAPFTINDGQEPLVEEGRYLFNLEADGKRPSGILSIWKDGDAWKCRFEPAESKGNYAFDLQLNAIDDDGDIASTPLHFERSQAPDLIYLGNGIKLDEGDQPYHQESQWHGNSGQNSVTFNLHGDDGTISFGDMTIAIEDGEGTAHKTTFTTGNGVVIELDDIYCGEDGIWRLIYSYSHNGEAQQHDRETADDSISSDIPITITSSNGKYVSGSVSCEIHDDVPVFGDVEVKIERAPIEIWQVHQEVSTAEYGYRFVRDNAFLLEFDPKLFDDFSGIAIQNAISSEMSGNDIIITLGVGESQPAGKLFLEYLGANRYLASFVQEEGRLYGADFHLSITGNDGQRYGFDASCGGVEIQLTSRDESGETIEYTFIPEIIDGKAVYDGEVWSVQECDPEELQRFFFEGGNRVADFGGGGIITIMDENSFSIDIDVIHDGNRDCLANMDLYGESITSLSGSFTISFGADGQSGISLTIENGIEPISIENGILTFEIKEHPELPDGILTIAPSENGKWSYSFTPTNPDLNFEGKIKISAIDGDGDTATADLSFQRHQAPEVVNLESGEKGNGIGVGEAVVDEGERPYHEGSHDENTGSFGVNLRGEDGVIRVGGIEIAVQKGEASWDHEATFEINGMKLLVIDVQPNGNGGFNVSYSYEYVDENGQQHGAPGSGTDNDLSGLIDISVTIVSGTSKGIITATIHDDVPIMSLDSEKGRFNLSFGKDGMGELPFTIEDGAIPASMEDGVYIFDIVDHGQIPNGQLVISQDARGWKYEFSTTSEISHYDGTIRLNAFDGDGDVAFMDLPVSKVPPPMVTAHDYTEGEPCRIDVLFEVPPTETGLLKLLIEGESVEEFVIEPGKADYSFEIDSANDLYVSKTDKCISVSIEGAGPYEGQTVDAIVHESDSVDAIVGKIELIGIQGHVYNFCLTFTDSEGNEVPTKTDAIVDISIASTLVYNRIPPVMGYKYYETINAEKNFTINIPAGESCGYLSLNEWDIVDYNQWKYPMYGNPLSGSILGVTTAAGEIPEQRLSIQAKITGMKDYSSAANDFIDYDGIQGHFEAVRLAGLEAETDAKGEYFIGDGRSYYEFLVTDGHGNNLELYEAGSVHGDSSIEISLDAGDNYGLFKLLSASTEGKYGSLDYIDGKWIYASDSTNYNTGIPGNGDDAGLNSEFAAEQINIQYERLSDNKVYNRHIWIKIIDDTPTMDDMRLDMAFNDSSTRGFDFSFGADIDGAYLSVVKDGNIDDVKSGEEVILDDTGKVDVEGLYGTLAFIYDKDSNAYSFSYEAKAEGTDRFIVRATDGDGDVVQKELIIHSGAESGNQDNSVANSTAAIPFLEDGDNGNDLNELLAGSAESHSSPAPQDGFAGHDVLAANELVDSTSRDIEHGWL